MTTKMTSAADIVVPGKPLAKSLIEQLRELASACGPNKHDQVITLITTLIEQRFDTKRRIISMLMKLDYDRGHIARLLNEQTGVDPSRCRWQVDAEGIYSLHPER